MNSKKSKIKYEKSSERKKARIISNKKPNKESNKESEKKVKKEIRKKTSEKTSEKNDKGVKKNPNNEYKKLSEERKRWYSFALKTTGWVLTIYLLINLTLYFMGRLSTGTFWITLIVIGILTYKVIPNWRIKINSM